MAPVTPEQNDTKTPNATTIKTKAVVPVVTPATPPAGSYASMYALFPTTPPTTAAPTPPNITASTPVVTSDPVPTATATPATSSTTVKPTRVVPANSVSATGASGATHGLFPTSAMTMPLPPVKTGRKRKPGPVKGSKRVKKTVIDDEVACSLFHDLRLSNEFLNNGKVLAWALQPDHEDFINIYNYVSRGQEHHFGLKILTILRVLVNANNLYEGAAPLEHQLDFNENPNTKGKKRAMLWHGTKRYNLVSILENGLRLPMYGGQIFGRGIYFADRISKSVVYCDRAYNVNGQQVAFLFLCDVLLGNIYSSYGAFNNGSPIGSWGTDSVMGVGRSIPNPKMDKEIDGCSWPLGQTIDNPDRSARLQYNEYIVYNVNQVKPKYLVKVEITRNPVHEKLS